MLGILLNIYQHQSWEIKKYLLDWPCMGSYSLSYSLDLGLSIWIYSAVEMFPSYLLIMGIRLLGCVQRVWSYSPVLMVITNTTCLIISLANRFITTLKCRNEGMGLMNTCHLLKVPSILTSKHFFF